MRPFGYQRVRSRDQAVAAAASGGRYLAGGTTLIDLMREEVETPTRLVDINALPLSGVRVDGDALLVGSLSRMAEVAAHPETQRLAPLVVEALIEGASPQLRNMASIGGNLLQRVRCPYFRMRDAACNKRAPGSGCAALDGVNAGAAILGTSSACAATHPSDLAVALVALDATLSVHGPAGERTFPVEELFLLPGQTPHLEHSLQPGELIVEVRIPPVAGGRSARYLKVRDRASYEFALVSVAAVMDVDGSVITSVRLAAGGVGTKPWRLRAVEQALVGQLADRDAYLAAAQLSVQDATVLPGNHHKRELLPRTVVRALEMVGQTR